MTAATDRAAADRARPTGRLGVGGRRDGAAKDPDAKPSKLEQLREKYPWLDHLVRAGARYTDHHGNHYAAAITYFRILSLVPLLMIAFAVAAYVLFFNPNLLTRSAGDHRGRCPRTSADGQPDHRPGDRPRRRRRRRPARRPLLRHRLDDQPA